jgi:hypothetical protein
MQKRIDPKPDPFAKQPVDIVRNPGRQVAKSVTKSSTEPQQRARAHVHSSNATQSIASATPTVVSFNTVGFDNVGLFASNKFTIPATGKITGAWYLHGHGIYAKAAGGTVRELLLRKNGTTTVVYSVVAPDTLDSLDVSLLINDPTAGDFYELIANQDSGAPLNLTTAAEKTFFEIIHLW